MTTKQKQADRSSEKEKVFTFEEYMKHYAPKNDTSESDDDPETVATAMADETLAILQTAFDD